MTHCLCIQNCKVELHFFLQTLNWLVVLHKIVIFKTVSGLLPVQAHVILPFFHVQANWSSGCCLRQWSFAYDHCFSFFNFLQSGKVKVLMQSCLPSLFFQSPCPTPSNSQVRAANIGKLWHSVIVYSNYRAKNCHQ